ncbi:MAG: iron-regulated protein A precursor [Gammaproteobacteria bacterium]|jgi:predicted lipoprotein|nr:MAG: iron-regulated protein A precursor [Gammaproteobacteria bacterium]PHR85158.1 MAG: iron-regulated protein A precursor [Colwellia sp.]
MLLKKTLIALTVSTLLLSGCGSSSSDNTTVEETSFTFDSTELITNLTNDVIVEGYETLNTKANAFFLATQNLVNTPTDENLLAAQNAWKAAREPWEQGESHIFGPVDSLSIDPHLDSWPLNTNDLQSLLDGTSTFSADFISLLNDDVQGFHTMEFLLFGDGVADNEKLIAEMTLREREYLSATAEVFQGYTQDLYDAWVSGDDAYQDKLLTVDNDIYVSQLAVVEELINGMIGIVDEVGNGKIADPFSESAATADTSLVESQYSWNSLTDFTDNIIGVQNVYRGEFDGAADKTGIIDFVHAADSTLATRVDDEITVAIAAIIAIAGENELPFRQAISNTEARVRIQAAIDALATLQASLENDVLTLLNDWEV